MGIRHLLLQKQSILLWIAILSGFFVITEEIFDKFELFRRQGVIPEAGSLSLLIFQFLFFILYTWILLQVNVRWQPESKGHLKQFACSLLVPVLFSAIVWIGVSPVIHDLNHGVRKKYKTSASGKYKNLYHEPEEAWYNNLFTLFITIYTLSRIYILAARKEEVERSYEKLKNESLQSQLDALYNQINPHFFFNALNSLHALIAEGEKQRSLTYLSNLSNVFRYILQSERKELVSLGEELSFLEIYRFMLSVKYEEKLEFDIHVTPEHTRYQLPVLSLLPLIENVIKHNEISSRNPMRISIYSTDEPALTIRNRKQPKLDEVEKVGIGLKNLSNRFALLVRKDVKIEDTEEFFRVSLPLIIHPKSGQS